MIVGDDKVVCSFRYAREGIACMPAIAKALGRQVWTRAPKGVMVADLPRGVFIDHRWVKFDDPECLTDKESVRVLVANY